ncbi:MAG: DUF429 domain-containing protein [Candidatus Altiarchaeum hamiconexum]|uniref:DUF429 domain-containing protein n=1 Tax=Candidatus Altarchaeum hamiconexum TaxID=1803513 RepID=A0A8J7YW07_9ARCH|nr:DUF429 domain-containing protein [Candidatus Altarchaeum hamiconexum]OIQ06038.1 MAG: hypothetical protein AUK59_01390 [Candidatus Altarchaeum sp. CG2_30_32_3053]PIV28664.1 MAG: DUF429 domain-containing protein [Candidatus Altarchaeum sp. CG03_land_8_20_14_0_80_32_618]PIX48804.1 MAG: DUF429 domain-containing protein [Candidatus Altarchaeum sp. CG_4_8_14_3_um_filter_33_2054]NCN69217.1 DUF429 domain-containing protein [Candidatus Altarchaeum hamiconexum]
MNFTGIDLAGTAKHATGFCILTVLDFEGDKFAETKILSTDKEIIEETKKANPVVIAIDAPLSSGNRKCDYDLKIYGALPLSLKSMEILAERGIKISNELKTEKFNVIEVFATATAKILGFHNKSRTAEQKELIKVIKGIDKRLLKKDEIDAVFCAITAYLYYFGKATEVGDERGKVLIPKI